MAANSFVGTLLADFILGLNKKPGSKLAGFLNHRVNQEYKRIYSEQINYQMAYLALLRRKLAPFLKDPETYPDGEVETEIMQAIYE
jgi:hypothetical protein